MEVKRGKKAKNVTENFGGFENICRKVWGKNSPVDELITEFDVR